MSLDPEKLAKALNDLFRGVPAFPADVDKAGEEWANIYREYVSGAVAGPTAPVADTLEPAAGVLAKALAGAFTKAVDAGPGGMAVVVAAMDKAFVAFWATPIPFAAPPAIAGVVTAPASGSLAGLMTTALAAGLVPGATGLQGTAVAAALDSWTKTVSVVNTAPPAPSQPPVNLT